MSGRQSCVSTETISFLLFRSPSFNESINCRLHPLLSQPVRKSADNCKFMDAQARPLAERRVCRRLPRVSGSEAPLSLVCASSRRIAKSRGVIEFLEDDLHQCLANRHLDAAIGRIEQREYQVTIKPGVDLPERT